MKAPLITDIDRVLLITDLDCQQKEYDFTQDLPCYELTYLFAGEEQVNLNGRIYDLAPNSIHFLPKGLTDLYTVTRQGDVSFIDIYFQTDIPLAKELFIFDGSQNLQLSALFKRIFEIWISQSDGYYYECISILYKILSLLQKKNYIPEHKFELIKPAIRYIEENFLTREFDYENLSHICGISYSYFKRLFIEKFGISPQKYINQMKINYACELLRNGRHSVTQVAALSGFSNVYYFCRAFKNHVGVSPGKYSK